MFLRLAWLPLVCSCVSADCTDGSCSASPRQASLLQVEARRNQDSALQSSGRQLEDLSLSELLRMTQEIAEQQTPDNGTNAGADATTAAPDAGGNAATAATATTAAPASNIMELIKRAVDKITAKLLETLSTPNTEA